MCLDSLYLQDLIGTHIQQRNKVLTVYCLKLVYKVGLFIDRTIKLSLHLP